MAESRPVGTPILYASAAAAAAAFWPPTSSLLAGFWSFLQRRSSSSSDTSGQSLCRRWVLPQRLQVSVVGVVSQAQAALSTASSSKASLRASLSVFLRAKTSWRLISRSTTPSVNACRGHGKPSGPWQPATPAGIS
jgi:hypothetical protein